MDQEQDSPKPPEQPSRTPGGSPAETPFDLWLNRSLHALYDGVTQEPIPAELLKLIAEDKTRQRGG
jgi:hypothetical protein